MHCFRANTWYRSENPRAVCVFVNPVLIPSSTNGRVDHFHPTRYLSHLPAGIFYCMPLRKTITQRNFLSLKQNNRPLTSSENPHFQNEARCTTILVKMNFICMRMKNDFHIKGWAPTFVLKQRPGELGNGLFGRLPWRTINFFSFKKRPNISLYLEYSRTLIWFFADFKFAYNTT